MILDDDPAAQELLAGALSACQDNLQIDRCGDLAQFDAYAGLTELDLVLIDLGLPDGSGLQALRQIRARGLSLLALVISTRSDQDSVLRALAAGADGYLCKYDAPVDIQRALEIARAGGATVTPSIAARLMSFARGEPACKPLPCLQLTKREHEILTLASKGCSFPQVAELTGTKLSTVYTHVRHIYEKLAVSNLPQALFEARHQGWL